MLRRRRQCGDGSGSALATVTAARQPRMQWLARQRHTAAAVALSWQRSSGGEVSGGGGASVAAALAWQRSSSGYVSVSVTAAAARGPRRQLLINQLNVRYQVRYSF